jgi:HEPN superfamily RiboL-PSP-like protein
VSMPEITPVDRLYREASEVVEALQKTPEVSLQLVAADHFRKSLLLAAASYFEHLICDCVVKFVRERSGGSTLVESFVRNKAIARQYHTWFQWEGNNANQFFGLFGSDFKSAMGSRIREVEEMQSSVRAFLELGNERNRLVHQDYATFQMEKTLDEIYILYQSALKFVETLPAALRDCDRVYTSETSEANASDQSSFQGTGL